MLLAVTAAPRVMREGTCGVDDLLCFQVDVEPNRSSAMRLNTFSKENSNTALLRIIN